MTCFSSSCFSLVCYMFCFCDLIFVISYSDYFPTFIPSHVLAMTTFPWANKVNSSWMEKRSELGLYNKGSKLKEWEVVNTKRSGLSGPNTTPSFSLILFQHLAAATESTNLSTLLTPCWCKACSWYWLEKPGSPLRHPPLACRILEI